MQVARMLGWVVIIGLSACDARPPTPTVHSPAVPTTSTEARPAAPPIEPLDHSKLGPVRAPTVRDSAESAGLTPLTKEKERNAMPLPGQANDHSSKNLEPTPQRATK